MNNITLQPELTLETLIEGTPSLAEDFIASQVFPEVNSKTLTGYFGRIDEGATRIVPTMVKGLAQNVVNYKLDRNASFEVINHELVNVIEAGEAERAGGWDAAKETMAFLLDNQIRTSREAAIANGLVTALTNGSNIATLAGGNQWSTPTSAVLSVIKTAKDNVARTGKIANTIIMGYPVFAALQFHPEMISALSPGKATPGLYAAEQMAMAFGVDRVLVGRAVYNSAKEGQAASTNFIWGKNAIVAYIAPSALAKFSKTLGAQVKCPDKARPTYIGSYIPTGKNPEQVQALVSGGNWDDKIITVNAGWLIKDAVA